MDERVHPGVAQSGRPQVAPAPMFVRWDETLPILHIYPQFTNHHPAQIIGTKAPLLALAAACKEAVAKGKAECRVLCRDGEGYSVDVQRTNPTGLGYTRLPYHPEWGGETDATLISRLQEQLRRRRVQRRAASKRAAGQLREEPKAPDPPVTPDG